MREIDFAVQVNRLTDLVSRHGIEVVPSIQNFTGSINFRIANYSKYDILLRTEGYVELTITDGEGNRLDFSDAPRENIDRLMDAVIDKLKDEARLRKRKALITFTNWFGV